LGDASLIGRGTGAKHPFSFKSKKERKTLGSRQNGQKDNNLNHRIRFVPSKKAPERKNHCTRLWLAHKSKKEKHRLYPETSLRLKKKKGKEKKSNERIKEIPDKVNWRRLD